MLVVNRSVLLMDITDTPLTATFYFIHPACHAGFVLYRTLGTIGNTHTLENRMSQLPHAEALDLYCREMLGADYEKQVGC